MFMSNFHFLRFAQKDHFQAVKNILTDGQTDQPTNLLIEAPCQSLRLFSVVTYLFLIVIEEGSAQTCNETDL